MWISSLLPLFIVAILIVAKQSKSRIIYAFIASLILYIWLFRFACGSCLCIFNTFLWGEDNVKADWNIRIGFDAVGFGLIGLLLALLIFYRKNYSIETLLQGVDAMNLFGVLTLKFSNIEAAVDKLTNEMQPELYEIKIQDKVMETVKEIYKNSNTPLAIQQLMLDSVKTELDKLDFAFEQKEKLLSKIKEGQFEQTRSQVKELFEFVKQDRGNKHINQIIIIAKKILALIYGVSDYIQDKNALRDTSKSKFLTENLGIELEDNKYDFILKKGTKIPVEKSKKYKTLEDGQKGIEIIIRVGNNTENAIQNQEVGKIVMTNLPLLPAGKVEISVGFKIDKFGVLIVKSIYHETNTIIQEDFDINKYLS